MRKGTLLAALLIASIGLAGCAGLADKITGAQTKVASIALAIQPELIPLCAAAMALSASNQDIAPWVIGACGTATAIDKLAADPTSTAWLTKLISQGASVINAAHTARLRS